MPPPPFAQGRLKRRRRIEIPADEGLRGGMAAAHSSRLSGGVPESAAAGAGRDPKNDREYSDRAGRGACPHRRSLEKQIAGDGEPRDERAGGTDL